MMSRLAVAFLCASTAQISAQTLPFELPESARLTASDVTEGGSQNLPVSPWNDGAMDIVLAEGVVRREAYVLPATSLTSLQILEPLRAALRETGYEVLFECDAPSCGGFDFRYALDLLPEPEMHVDLGDFRYLTAETADETMSLVTSRGASEGYLHITRIGGSAALRSPRARPVPEPPPPASEESIAVALVTNGGAVLDDLVFQTGSADLDETTFPSLIELAAYLRDDPDAVVVLVGHTDAEGGLDQNVALSRRRAESVRQRLIDVHDVAPDRLRAEGVGYLVPRASNASAEGRALNRRVEVIKTATE